MRTGRVSYAVSVMATVFGLAVVALSLLLMFPGVSLVGEGSILVGVGIAVAGGVTVMNARNEAAADAETTEWGWGV
jgi:hypothetical protein